MMQSRILPRRWEATTTASHFVPTTQLFTPNNQIYQIYAGVSIPIFDFGALSSAQHAAQARDRLKLH